MAASAPETAVPRRLTAILIAPLLLGAALLIVAEFLPLYEIRVITAVPKGGHHSTGEHHLYAMAVLGLAMVPMAYGAVKGGSFPAAIGLLALALAAVFVALVVDLPDLNDEGFLKVTYDQAQARPRVGFFVESLGATLALLGSIGTLLLRRR